MDTRFLESLIKVIETGSIAETARCQHLTAAAVSQRIKALEVELNLDLLIRDGNRVKVTSAGAELLPQIHSLLAQAHNLLRTKKNRLGKPLLHLGTIPSQWNHQILTKLNDVRSRDIGYRFQLSFNTSRILYQSLINGQIDVIVIEAPDFLLPTRICTVPLRKEALALISNRREEHDLKHILASNNYIEYRPDPFICNHAAKFLNENELFVDPIYSTGSLETIRLLVTEGAGVSLVPLCPTIAQKTLKTNLMKVEGDGYEREIVLLHSAASNVITERLLTELKWIFK